MKRTRDGMARHDRQDGGERGREGEREREREREREKYRERERKKQTRWIERERVGKCWPCI